MAPAMAKRAPHRKADVSQTGITRGIGLFNECEFWHAHEAWEELWLVAGGERKRFLQGLIQLAAAYHHVKRGTLRGAGRLFDAAVEKLAPFAPDYEGVDRAAAISAALVHRRKISEGEAIEASEYPKLRYNATTSSTQRNLTHRGV